MRASLRDRLMASGLPPGGAWFDFIAMAGTLDSRLSLTRASTAWGFDSSGNLASFSTDVPVFDHEFGTGKPLGIRVERTRTNALRWSRDLTNALWAKTSCAAAMTATGIDGVSNSASVLTASGANATCLQAVTASSTGTNSGAYVKRVTGSGTVSMTVDGGSTYTDITSQLSSAWARITIPLQTLANPSFGFKIATSGDAIAVDDAQMERGGTVGFDGLASPIPTTSVTLTRASDLLTASLSGLNMSAPAGMSVAAILQSETGVVGFVWASVDDGSATHVFQMRGVSNASPQIELLVVNVSGSTVFGAPDQQSARANPFGVAAAATGLAGTITMNGRPPQPMAALPNSTPASLLTTLRIGSDFANGTGAFNGWIRQVGIWPYVLSPAALAAVSIPR